MNETPVVNASPLIYLSRAGLIDLLKVAGDRVLVPDAVAEEIGRRGRLDPTVRAVEANSWLDVVQVKALPPEILAWSLGPGESAVRPGPQHTGVAGRSSMTGQRGAAQRS